MQVKKVVFLMVLLLLSACGNTEFKDKLNKLIKNKIDNINLENIEYIIIIPNQGCDGCISSAEEFYKNNKNRDDLFFIFTSVVSVKTLNIKLNINKKTTYVDFDNDFIKVFPNNKRIYPLILSVKAGEISDISFQLPDKFSYEDI